LGGAGASVGAGAGFGSAAKAKDTSNKEMKITANFSLNMGISPRRDANRRRLGHGWHNNAARLVARFAG